MKLKYWASIGINRDTFRVEITTENQRLTKRNVLKTLSSIYNPLGFISPVLLIGLILFQNLCNLRIPWYNEIPEEMENKLMKWVKGLNKVNEHHRDHDKSRHTSFK